MAEEKTFSFKILEFVEDYHQKYGLQFDDYEHYRKFCARKVRRIRRRGIVNFVNKPSTGKAFVARNLLEEVDVSKEGADAGVDVRSLEPRLDHIELLVFETERVWSHAMELKGKTENEQETNGVSVRHKKRKFRKAVQWGRKLVSYCERFANQNTILQAKTYMMYIASFASLELGKLDDAAKEYSALIKLYEAVQGVVPAAIILPKKEKAEYFLAYCKRYLQQEGMDISSLNTDIDGEAKSASLQEEPSLSIFGLNLKIDKGELISEIQDFQAKYQVFQKKFQSFEKMEEQDYMCLYSLVDSIISGLKDLIKSKGSQTVLIAFQDLLKTKKQEIVAQKSLMMLRTKMETFESEKSINLYKLCERSTTAFEQLDSKNEVDAKVVEEIKCYECFILACIYTQSNLIDSYQTEKSMKLFTSVVQTVNEYPALPGMQNYALQRLSIFLLEGSSNVKATSFPTPELNIKMMPIPTKPFTFDLVLDKLRPELYSAKKASVSSKENKASDESSSSKQWFGGWFKST